MSVAPLTPSGDWSLGREPSGVLTGDAEVVQGIATRLRQWRGTWFADLDDGIDWRALLGAPGQLAEVEAAAARAARAAPGVAAVTGVEAVPTTGRGLALSITVRTVFTDSVEIALEVAPPP